MGWASAGHSVFDPVMDTLIDSGCPANAIQEVAERLIGVLSDMDWDTEQESLDNFEHCKPVVRAFNRYGFVAKTQKVNGEVIDMIRCQGCDTSLRYRCDPDGSVYSAHHDDASTGNPCGYGGLGPRGR